MLTIENQVAEILVEMSHGNDGPKYGRTEPEGCAMMDEIQKGVVYSIRQHVYTPSEKNREDRVKAYKSGDACSHWANKCEIKRYPWGFGPRHKKKNLFRLEPKLIEGEIPPERLAIL